MLDSIIRFSGPWAFLSNFHPAPLEYDGFPYATSEHAFNAGKTLDLELRAWVAKATTPAEAKRRGRHVQLRPGWDKTVRYQVMAEVLRAKFTCRPERQRALLATGDSQLVEGNDWHDTHWGVCRCLTHRNTGENHLGRLLMSLRRDLRWQPRRHGGQG